VRQDATLPIPAGCPDEFAMVMRACWRAKPADRISFKEIYSKIEDLLQRGK
jgi:hypothetical protein